jgi:hypothetical protein
MAKLLPGRPYSDIKTRCNKYFLKFQIERTTQKKHFEILVELESASSSFGRCLLYAVQIEMIFLEICIVDLLKPIFPIFSFQIE